MTAFTHTAIILDDMPATLPNLADLCRTSDAVTTAVDTMVGQLRAEGTTWRVLAEVTGMTEVGLRARQRRLHLDQSEVTE